MQKCHYKSYDGEPFELFGQIRGMAYNTSKEFPNAGVSYLQSNSEDYEHKMSTCLTSDIFYYIIEGNGTFVIGGQKIEAKDRDVVLVPRNTEYGYWGKMKYVLFYDTQLHRRLRN